MIQMQTNLDVADNSGAREIMCIRVLGGSSKQYGAVGDTIIAAVKHAQPNAGVKKGDVVRAVIVRTAQEYAAWVYVRAGREVLTQEGKPQDDQQAYDRGRPSYPAEAVSLLKERETP